MFRIILLLLLTSPALAKEEIVTGPDGKVFMRFVTDSNGVTTTYGPNGNIIVMQKGDILCSLTRCWRAKKSDKQALTR